MGLGLPIGLNPIEDQVFLKQHAQRFVLKASCRSCYVPNENDTAF